MLTLSHHLGKLTVNIFFLLGSPLALFFLPSSLWGWGSVVNVRRQESICDNTNVCTGQL